MEFLNKLFVKALNRQVNEEAVDVGGYLTTTIFQLTTVIIGTLLLSCTYNPNKTPNYTAANDTLSATSRLQHQVDTPRSFVRNYGINDNNKIFVFVGEKLSIEPLPSKRYSFDNGFKAKYLILQKIFGDFPVDTIEFIVYDHYGTPSFQNSKMYCYMFLPTVVRTFIRNICTMMFIKLKMLAGRGHIHWKTINTLEISEQK
jgi:hypothetical protein